MFGSVRTSSGIAASTRYIWSFGRYKNRCIMDTRENHIAAATKERPTRVTRCVHLLCKPRGFRQTSTTRSGAPPNLYPVGGTEGLLHCACIVVLLARATTSIPHFGQRGFWLVGSLTPGTSQALGCRYRFGIILGGLSWSWDCWSGRTFSFSKSRALTEEQIPSSEKPQKIVERPYRSVYTP